MDILWKHTEEKQMEICEHQQVTYLRYKSFQDTNLVKHGFSTRLGGVSKGIFESMNLSFTRGDDKEAVQENYRRMANAIGVDYESIVCSDQTHTTNVRKVGQQDCGHGITREKEFFDVDGLITNEPGVTLATFYADCVPLYFLDPVHKAIGLSHSGWKGTVGKIGQETILAMKKAYGSKPEELLVAIGPSICQECYEVSEDVAIEFKKVFSEPKKILQEKENGKYQLDLWAANRIILEEAGVQAEHITMPDICTCCNPKFLYSHRASSGKRGNLGAFLCLK